LKNIFVISDTHFGHENIIGYSQRPFVDIDEMDEIMVKNWNAVVKPGDHVYHLGDVYMGSGARFLTKFARLNGKKRLVVGNHDDLKKKIDGKVSLCDLFEKVMLWRIWKDEGLLFTHVPTHPSTLGEGRMKTNSGKEIPKTVNVHGHIHTNPSPEGPYFCACVEQEHMGYTPIHIDQIKDIINRR
jgi:calcineurin-like phosphoesterase family protein